MNKLLVLLVLGITTGVCLADTPAAAAPAAPAAAAAVTPSFTPEVAKLSTFKKIANWCTTNRCSTFVKNQAVKVGTFTKTQYTNTANFVKAHKTGSIICGVTAVTAIAAGIIYRLTREEKQEKRGQEKDCTPSCNCFEEVTA